MPKQQSLPRRGAARDDDADAVLAACRVLVTLSARSIAAVEDVADVTQVRALVVMASRGSVSLGELAAAANLHLSRASRLCDRLVAEGLIHRADDPADRRQLTLNLTPDGEQVVRTVMQYRRVAIKTVLAQLTPQRRTDLVTVLQEFAAAAGESSDAHSWAMGWTT